jgi:hypothetical protein
MSTVENPALFQIIPGFVSCKTCFETYKYIDSGTANLNAHICCRNLDPDQSAITSFVQSPRSTVTSKAMSKKKEELKRLCTKWISGSMRSFQIVNDPGFKELTQLCLDIGKGSIIRGFLRWVYLPSGREFRAETRMDADYLLPCDRTVKNELDRLASENRNTMKKILVSAAENRSLSISPDNWTDNHRRVSYMGATVHFVDDELSYQSLDLFCVEFVEEKKTAENIYQVSEFYLMRRTHPLFEERWH